MSRVTKILSTVGIVIAIAIVFFVGFGISVYWSLRSSEVRVPDVVGKDRFVAENELTGAGLNFRVRAIRPSNQVKSDSILFQLPRAGEIVKAGQTVAVDVSRPAKEGEASDTIKHADDTNTDKANENANTNQPPAGNLNENKPKRNRNSNSNANGNTNAANRNSNSHRPKPNANENDGTTNANGRRTNSNRTGETNNQNSSGPNRNANRAKPPAPATPPPR